MSITRWLFTVFALGLLAGTLIYQMRADVPRTVPKAPALPGWAHSLLAPSPGHDADVGFVVTVRPAASECQVRTHDMRLIATFTCRAAAGVQW